MTKINLNEELNRIGPQRAANALTASRAGLALATKRRASALAFLASFQTACVLEWDGERAVLENDDAPSNSSTSQGVEQSEGCATSLLDTFQAQAQPLVLAGYVGASDTHGARYDTDTSVLGGHRHVALSLGDAAAGSAMIETGGGLLRITQTDLPEAYAEISYGAFVHPPEDPNAFGPLLGLDLSENRGLLLSFTDLSDPVGITATYFSSQALDPADPVHYAHATIVAPTNDKTVVVFFRPDDGDAFNWEQVDGVVLTLHLQTSATHSSLGLNAVAAFRLQL